MNTAVPAAAVRIALAQLDFTVGAIDANADRVIAAARQARDALGAHLVAFPELALTGYPPEDLLFRPALFRRVEAALARIRAEVHGIRVIVGVPELDGAARYNAAAILDAGAVAGWYRKQHLPNYGVFDERRYFSASSAPVAITSVNGRRLALSICEDLWHPGTAAQAAVAGAELLININASPYHLGKDTERIEMLTRNYREAPVPIAYLNLVGGQDELVFDGASLMIDRNGARFCGSHFEESLIALDLRADGTIEIASPCPPAPASDADSAYRALVLGVRDYVRKNGFKGAVLGLSGGIDSALTLAIAVDALGADAVQAVLMPSRYTARMSIDDAYAEARALGVRADLVSIETAVSAFAETLAPVFAGTAADVTEENVQARCRGVVLMAISNKFGRLLLTTGNKSEMSVGYATLYGDMAGGFAPLKDVSKLLVYRLAEWRNARAPVIPRRVFDRPPTAELRPDQKDEDSLPPYPVLDPILERYVELDQSPAEIIAAGFDADMVVRVARLVDRAEYKRRQAAPGVRITRRAFGRDRRVPITSQYDETR